MKKIAESHLDHGLSEPQVAHLFERFADRDAFFIETIELPEELGMVDCALYGPSMGDPPVTDAEVYLEKRGEREYLSRCIDRASRQTRTVTVIAGPHETYPCVLYTAFGGPLAPQEFGDPTCKDLAASTTFWAEHALARAKQ